MRHEEFVRWAGTHTTAFGLGASEYDSILAWFHPFDVLGFTGDDLRSSTEWIIANANPIPKWIREHLPIIRDHCTKLVQARLNQIHAKDFNTPDKGECVKCFDAVWICVPHPKSYDQNRVLIGNYTGGVLCNCHKGYNVSAKMNQAKVDQKNPERNRIVMPLGIAEYEADYPDWREQLEARNRAKVSISDGCRDQPLDEGIRRVLENAMKKQREQS